LPATAATIAVLIAVAPAHAELTLYNRTSYRLEAAIGTIASRDWFCVDPGECRQVVAEPLDSDMVYMHARTPPVYGNAPLRSGRAVLCIRDGDFALGNARACPLTQQAHFSPVHPSESPQAPTGYLAEAADYDDAQARLAGMQRLLAIAG
jgi:uncharacterized membrane protein